MSEHTIEPSAAFRRFTDSFAVSSRESAEDYDLEALNQLEGHERDQAEALLIDTVRTTDDPRAPKAIRALALQSAVPALREAIDLRSGQALVESALTLFVLSGDEAALPPITRMLRDDSVYTRVDAAHALGQIGGSIAELALYPAIDDPDPLVRANAVESLLHLTGLAEWDVATGRGISLLGLGLRSSFASVRQRAIVELKQLAAARRAGSTAEELGLPTGEVERSAAAAKALRSLSSRAGSGPWADGFDLEAITEVAEGSDEAERDWALATLLLLLERGDVRAPGGLAALGRSEAVAPLREAAATADGQMAAAIADAITSLS